MAGIRRMLCYRRTHGRRYIAHSFVVYLHFFSHAWLAVHSVHGARLLDEHEAVYASSQEESAALALIILFFLVYSIHSI
jgi:hypothetical protein